MVIAATIKVIIITTITISINIIINIKGTITINITIVDIMTMGTTMGIIRDIIKNITMDMIVAITVIAAIAVTVEPAVRSSAPLRADCWAAKLRVAATGPKAQSSAVPLVPSQAGQLTATAKSAVQTRDKALRINVRRALKSPVSLTGGRGPVFR